MTVHNDRRMGLINGERGTVLAVAPLLGDVVVKFDQRRDITRVWGSYLADGGLEHAYAMTVHKAQGLTCDRTYVLADEHLDREAGYTALSRGRKENRLYAVTPEPDEESHVRLDPDIVHDAVRRALERSSGKDLASEFRRRGRDQDADLDQGVEIDL